MPSRNERGIKYDSKKDPMELLSVSAMRGTAKVMGFGARKYTARNWEKGMEWGRVYAAALRHLTAFWAGEERDKESGLSHLDHAACCVMFLQHYSKHRVGKDDRPKYKRKH